MQGTDRTKIDLAGAVIECSMVPWDTEIFGFPVAQVDRIDLARTRAPGAVLDAFDSWCDARGVRLVSARLDHTDLEGSMALEGLGFRFVEMVYVPRLDRFDGIGAPKHEIAVGVARPDDLAAVQEVARSAFDTGRFLLDHRLDPELSRRRYATWVRNSAETADHTVLTFEIGGQLVGFFIVERRAGGDAYWHLTAVAAGWQGKGVGTSIWQTMLLRHRTEGVTSVETTISAHNLPAMNLYSRLGFSFTAAQTTFHWLRGPAAGPGVPA